MPITPAERRSWTQQGAQGAAQATYTSVKAALAQSTALKAHDFEVFLQGSYANATNTRGDSDVDIVVMLQSTFMTDTSLLAPADAARYRADRTAGEVTQNEFRSLVQAALNSYYGRDRVEPKNKCLRVSKRDGYVDADVVPAFQHRRYVSYASWSTARFVEGIEIRPLSGSSIVNYPKVHRRNGSAKNADCHDLYKPTVRQVKRLRRRAVDLGLLSKTDAPGYLLECMTYNVSAAAFIPDDSDRLIRVMAHLNQASVDRLYSNFLSCDGIHHLFRDDPGGHNQYTARRVIDVLWELV